MNSRIDQCELVRLLLQHWSRGALVVFRVYDCPLVMNVCNTRHIGGRPPYDFHIVRPGPSRWHVTLLAGDGSPYLQHDCTSLEEFVDKYLLNLTRAGSNIEILLQNGTIFHTSQMVNTQNRAVLRACVIGCARSNPETMTTTGNNDACCKYTKTCCRRERTQMPRSYNHLPCCNPLYRQATVNNTSMNVLTPLESVCTMAENNHAIVAPANPVIVSPPTFMLSPPQEHIERVLRAGGWARVYLPSAQVIHPFSQTSSVRQESLPIELKFSLVSTDVEDGFIQCTWMEHMMSTPMTFMHMHQWLAIWTLLPDYDVRVHTSDDKQFHLRKQPGAEMLNECNCCYSEDFFMMPHKYGMRC